MATKKSPATKKNPNNPENPIQVLKEDTCPTSSGKSTLTYQVGVDASGITYLKISGNDGGGFWSAEWVNYSEDIREAIKAWPEDQGITSMTFRKIFRGKSSNTPGFLIAVLVAEELLEPMPGKSRVHQPCDPSAFLDSVSALQGGAAPASKKFAPKAKAKTKAKTASKAKVKTPRKTASSSRKTK
jgi:hypothetical protein